MSLPPSLKLHYGLSVESEAERWYLARVPGAQLLERNFRWRGGEIDLIFEEPSQLWLGRLELVFVEVRARTAETAWVSGIESIDAKKLVRLRRGVAVYLSRYFGNAFGARLDVVTWDGSRFEHWSNADCGV